MWILLLQRSLFAQFSFCDESSNLQDVPFRWSYLAALVQCMEGSASWEVAKSLGGWIKLIQQNIDSGISRDDILDSFNKVNLASDSLCDASFKQVKFS